MCMYVCMYVCMFATNWFSARATGAASPCSWCSARASYKTQHVAGCPVLQQVITIWLIVRHDLSPEQLKLAPGDAVERSTGGVRTSAVLGGEGDGSRSANGQADVNDRPQRGGDRGPDSGQIQVGPSSLQGWLQRGSREWRADSGAPNAPSEAVDKRQASGGHVPTDGSASSEARGPNGREQVRALYHVPSEGKQGLDGSTVLSGSRNIGTNCASRRRRRSTCR